MSTPVPSPSAPRLLDQVRERVRYLHYSIRTEEACVHWIGAFVHFHGRRHPREMGGPQVEAFLSWLSTERAVSVETHRQALSALLFLYQQVLGQRLPWMDDIDRPQRKPRLPVVLSPDEVAAALVCLAGTHRLLAKLLYGTGMRIAEALQVRVKDVEFDRRVVIVRSGKGGKDRVVMLPATLAPGLREPMQHARVLWEADARASRGGVQLPDALERKHPRAGVSWAWFWIFPQADHSACPRTGVERRHHRFDQTFQRAFKRAVQVAGIEHLAKAHTHCATASPPTCCARAPTACGTSPGRGFMPGRGRPLARIAGMCGAIFGACATMVASTLAGTQPAARTQRSAWASRRM